MTEDEAREKTKQLFGDDSFTEFDDAGGLDRYYVGALPKSSGPYTGFMGFSWEEALAFASKGDDCQNKVKRLEGALSEIGEYVWQPDYIQSVLATALDEDREDK